MKPIYYGIIIAITFSVLLTNAFFGHLLFASETQQVIHKYSVYVHLLSEWDSGSKNIIFDVTNSWYNSEKDNNTNHVFNAESKEYNYQKSSFHFIKIQYLESDLERDLQFHHYTLYSYDLFHLQSHVYRCLIDLPSLYEEL